MKKIIFILLIALGASAPLLWAFPNSPLKMKASAQVGYDNNSYLNAERKGSLFAIESLDLNYPYQVCDNTKLRLSYGIFNVNYFSAADENMLEQDAGAGLDFQLAPGTTLETDYNFEYDYYANNQSLRYDTDEDSATNASHKGRAGLKQVINDFVTLRGGFSVTDKGFEDRKIREADGHIMPEDQRSDMRYTPDAEIILKVSKRIVLKGGFNYIRNESNYVYQDYYDYEAYKFYTKANLKLTSKLTASLKLSYERRDYDSRPLIDDSTVFQRDDIYVGSASLYYKLTRDLSLGAVYAYRQKNSNEPSQSYSGSISTLGLYFTF